MTTARSSRKRGAPPAGPVVASLDIGSHKVCCLIGFREGEQRPGSAGTGLRLLGLGHQRSDGIAAGAVCDLERARVAVTAAIMQAEQAAGVRIERVALGVSCGNPRSRTFNGHVDLPEGIVREIDIARLDSGARAYATKDGDALVALGRLAYSLDGIPAVTAPIGLAGRSLDAHHHAVVAATGPVRNLCMLAKTCHVEPSLLLPAGYASALASTTQAERRAGVIVVDVGACVTTVAGFADGDFIYSATLPLGGQQVTKELARALAVPLAEAERIKTLYASLAASALDEHEYVQLTREADGGDVGTVASRAEVGRIVAGCMSRLLAHLRHTLDGCGSPVLRRAGIVLTGGVSGLVGLEGFAGMELARTVRVAGPPRLEGASARMLGSVPGPAFACAVGLALAALEPSPWIETREERPRSDGSYLARVGQWLRESF